MRTRHGFVLGVVVLVFLLLGVFLFSYNQMVRQQNIRAHHEMIGGITSRLAISGVELLSSELAADFNALLQGDLPQLCANVMGTGAIAESIDVSATSVFCGKVRVDYQNFLDQITDDLAVNSVFTGASTAKCDDMSLKFDNIRQISPNTDTDQLQAGRDPVEKTGEVTISCTVSFRGLARRAAITRQFRVVSMVPGVVGRFSLFVPFTPWEHSYNGLGVMYEGLVNRAGARPTNFPASLPVADYKHQVPGTTQVELLAPLKVFNSTDTYIAGEPVDDEKDLKTRGWVFLGPCPDSPTTCRGPIYLKIPSGYNNEAGGHFMFSTPTGSVVEIVPTETIQNAHYFHDIISSSDSSVATVTLGGMFQGFYTFEEDDRGAAGRNLWPGLLGPDHTWQAEDRWLSAATWLFPYGDRNNPSRTLMVGNVFAGFLRNFFLKHNVPETDPNFWKGILLGVPEPSYNVNDLVSLTAGGGLYDVTYAHIFKQPEAAAAADPNKVGMESLARTMPYNSVPEPNPTGLSVGITPGLVPFNLIFDFMRYDVMNSVAAPPRKYPELHSPPQIAQSPLKDRACCVPYGDLVSGSLVSASTPHIPGIHPCEEFRVLFSESGGLDPHANVDNYFFKGNLRNYNIGTDNLLSRITHFIDLRETSTPQEEQAVFQDAFFSRNPLSTPAEFSPRYKGIIAVLRQTPSTGTLGELKLPGPINVDKPFILIVSEGDLAITGAVTSLTKVGDTYPTTLCSLVTLQGDILVCTNLPIHAYLVALNRPSATVNGPGGRVRAGLRHNQSTTSPFIPTPTSSANNELKVYGGVACWEMGLYGPALADSSGRETSMKSFVRGGEIRYNPMFNPSGIFYPLSREFIMEDRPSRITVSGAK